MAQGKKKGPRFTANVRVVTVVEVALPDAKTFEEARVIAEALKHGEVVNTFTGDELVDWGAPQVIGIQRTDLPWTD